MPNTLFHELSHMAISHIGFDLDGTLYDEADYVFQAYQVISRYFATVLSVDEAVLHQQLCQRWQQKGSSYPFIFSELLNRYQLDTAQMQPLIRHAVQLYRSTQARLVLPEQSAELLQQLQSRYSLFLITDGQVETQSYKIKQLGLLRWFEPERIIITGGIAADAAKPSLKALTLLPELALVPADQILYVGDRTVDQDFAAAAGFRFCQHRIVHRDYYEKT